MKRICVGPINNVTDYSLVVNLLNDYEYRWNSGDLINGVNFFYPGIILHLNEDKKTLHSSSVDFDDILVGVGDLMLNPEKYLGGGIKNYFSLEDIT